MSIQGDQHSSPHDMFFFGMLEHSTYGFKGLKDNEDLDNLVSYGIDWESINNCRLIDHYHANSKEDELSGNPLSLTTHSSS